MTLPIGALNAALSNIHHGLKDAIYGQSKGLSLEKIRVPGSDLFLLRQNPNTSSKWAALAREGKEVFQIIEDGGRYKGVIVDGKIEEY